MMLNLIDCGAQCILREVSLKDIPAQMLKASSKGTVPVLVIATDKNGEPAALVDDNSKQQTHRVIDESIDIMRWAMIENTSRDIKNANAWQSTDTMSTNEVDALIDQNDFEFKAQLDKYKYSDRHPEHTQHYYLEQAMPFLEQLENLLAKSPFLGGSQFRFPDAAILPFIRQFSMVEPKTFDSLALPKIQKWLAQSLKSDLFVSVMTKYPIWHAHSDEDPVVFGKHPCTD